MIVATIVLVYFGAYLYLRLDLTFVHRAGSYGYDARKGKEILTNHYIETSLVTDGPQVFGMVMMAAAANRENDEIDPAEIEKMLQESSEKVKEAQEHRDRLFAFFKPAAFIETTVWKIIDPDPLSSRELD